jgi:hypothetical protein
MKFLLTGHLPVDFDPSTMDEDIPHNIHALNTEMEAAGALFFAGGLYPVSLAKTARSQPDGKVIITDGPYLETKEYIGGILILEAADLGDALEWARKGAIAARGSVEVRQIFFDEG